MNLLVFIQYENDKINSVSLEALKGAQEIAEKSNGTVRAITFSLSVAESLTQYDIKEILFVDNPKLSIYNPLYFVKTFNNIFFYSSYFLCYGATILVYA